MAGQPLHPRRPFGGTDAGGDRRIGNIQAGGADRRHRDPGVVVLEGAGQRRLWQVKCACGVGVAQAGGGGLDPPIGVAGTQHGADTGGLGAKHFQHRGLLAPGYDRYARLHDAGLFGGDDLDGGAQHLAVIERDRGDRRGRRMLHHVGGVMPSAEADFEHAEIGGHPGEQHECRRHQHFENGDRRAGVDLFDLGKGCFQRGVIHDLASKPDALVEAYQMRRGEHMHAQARRLADGAQEGAGAALAVGAGDMDHRRQPKLGVVEQPQQPVQPDRAEVDHARIQRMQPLDHGADPPLQRRIWRIVAHLTRPGRGSGHGAG